MENKKRILIADDDHDFVSVLSLRLKTAGFEVFQAYKGVEVLELVDNKHPDLILLDWKMPVGMGDSVIECLSEKDETKNIPIIILSGLDEEMLRHRANYFGVKAIIKKPYDPASLIETLNKFLPV